MMATNRRPARMVWMITGLVFLWLFSPVGRLPSWAETRSNPVAEAAPRLAAVYPHWAAEDLPKAALLERFLQRHRGGQALIVSDFDGTLVDEEWLSETGERCSGQSAWHIWGACHLAEFPGLFPKFATGDPAAQKKAILRHNAILEGWTPVQLSPWIKFYEIGTFEAGMTPAAMREGLEAFFHAEPPERHVFLPMLDLLQRGLDLGCRVWIVSGSNPHFINAFLSRIRGRVEYQPGRPYALEGLVVDSYAPMDSGNASGARVIGNMARLRHDGIFSDVAEDRFVTDLATEPTVIEGRGKVAAIHGYIEPLETARAVMVCGNSDGDAEMAQMVLERPRTLVIQVNPRGKRFPVLPADRTVRLELAPSHPSPGH